MPANATVLMEHEADLIAPPQASSHCEDAIRNLVHDLRQPLSTIEAIAYYLEMTLPADQLEARRYLSRLQQVVQESNVLMLKSIRESRARDATPFNP
jgi:signal transduction histidine kinase